VAAERRGLRARAKFLFNLTSALMLFHYIDTNSFAAVLLDFLSRIKASTHPVSSFVNPCTARKYTFGFHRQQPKALFACEINAK
jgi:hypothetical protein